MTLTQLAYLLAVDRTRSFREAARECHVTQPALSQQLRKLEDELGERVFDRSRQPVVPTEAGRRILDQARVVLREADRMADVVAEMRGELVGTYRLGIIPTLASTLLPLVLPRFTRAHPRVELVVDELQTAVMLERLRSDALDGGIAATPLHAPGIHERPLYREPFSAYVAARHPLARHRRIAEADLSEQGVWVMAEGHCFRDQVLQLCGPQRAVASRSGGAVRFESGSFETLMRLVDEDFGITVLPELVIRGLPAARRRRHVRPFSPPVPSREVGFVHGRDHLRRAIADALVEMVRATLPADLVAAAERGTGRVLPPLPGAAPGSE